MNLLKYFFSKKFSDLKSRGCNRGCRFVQAVVRRPPLTAVGSSTSEPAFAATVNVDIVPGASTDGLVQNNTGENQ